MRQLHASRFSVEYDLPENQLRSQHCESWLDNSLSCQTTIAFQSQPLAWTVTVTRMHIHLAGMKGTLLGSLGGVSLREVTMYGVCAVAGTWQVWHQYPQVQRVAVVSSSAVPP